MNLVHVVDSECSCAYCTMVNVMWGDPGLSPWEFKFVNSVSRYGWIADYTIKQKHKIQQIFFKRRKAVLERSQAKNEQNTTNTNRNGI